MLPDPSWLDESELEIWEDISIWYDGQLRVFEVPWGSEFSRDVPVAAGQPWLEAVVADPERWWSARTANPFPEHAELWPLCAVLPESTPSSIVFSLLSEDVAARKGEHCMGAWYRRLKIDSEQMTHAGFLRNDIPAGPDRNSRLIAATKRVRISWQFN